MNQSFLSTQKTGEKLLKLKNLLENTKVRKKNQNLLIESEKSVNFSPNLEKNLPLFLSLIEKPVNLLFSLDQFLFEFSKKTYQQRKTGEFFQQLKERKKLSLFYGSLSQKQLKNLFAEASEKKGYFAKNLFSLLERRLDVVLYRSGLVKTIAEARQLISHQKITVNSQKITIASYCLNPGDVITFTADTLEKATHEIQNQTKTKGKFLKIFGELLSKLKTNSGLTIQKLHKKKISGNSKNLCNLLVELISTRIQLRSFLNVKIQKLESKTENGILALLKWKKSSTSPTLSEKNVVPLEKVHGGQKKQGRQQDQFYACSGSLQKTPVFWSSRMTNSKPLRANGKFQKQVRHSPQLSEKNQKLSLEVKNSFFMTFKHLENSQKFTRLLSLNLRKYLMKRSFYPQKSLFQKILDFRLVKPVHLEISYNLLTIVYLYSPQRINFPFYIDLDLIKRSFR